MCAYHGNSGRAISQVDDGYELTLSEMDDKVLYFSDRPERKAGFITLSTFMDGWSKGSNSFKADHPNAAFIHAALKINDNGVSEKAAALMLYSPQAVSERSWKFKLKSLQNNIMVGDYNEVSVFVDPSMCISGSYIPCTVEGTYLL